MEDDNLNVSEVDTTETKEVEQPQSEAKKENEVEDPYFHLSDGNYIGGLTMPS
jgi:hypothetical protein